MGWESFNILWFQREAILHGLETTIWVSFVSTFVSIVVGAITVWVRQALPPPGRWIAQAYVQFFRNTPLLVQIFFFYKALPYFSLNFSPVTCGIIALSLQTGAYMAEIFRTGLSAIPREQMESGLSLGLSKPQTLMRIIFPQALGIILPPMGNQVISLMKNSSLLAFITVPELFYVVYQGGATHFQYLEYFTLGIVLYMGLALLLSLLFVGLEKLFVIVPMPYKQQEV